MTDELNNDFWLDTWRDDPWWPAIEECDELLTWLIPGYIIRDIKTKFGWLCYYIDLPEGVKIDSPKAKIAHMIIDNTVDRAARISGYSPNWQKDNS